MSGLRCLVVDHDERRSAEIAFAIESSDVVDSVLIANDLDAALSVIRRQAVDALFIGLEPLTPAQVNAVKQAPWLPAVVGVSSRPQDAAIAFELDAVDFLPTPLASAKVNRALAKLVRCSCCRVPEHVTYRIAISRGEELKFIDARDIHYVESDGDYTRVISDDGIDSCRQSLGSLEERLQTLGFLRIHRRWLVSAARVQSLISDDGKWLVRVAGTDLPVARRLVSEVRARLS